MPPKGKGKGNGGKGEGNGGGKGGGKGRGRGRNKGENKPKTTFFFFGNSYTSYHTLAARVKKFYLAGTNENPKPNINTPRHSPGGASFVNHVQWMRSKGKDVPDFKKGHAWIILQEQSLTPAIPKFRSSSDYGAKALNQFAAEGEAQTMFYMTWGRRNGWKGSGLDFPDFKVHNAAIVEGYLNYVKITSTDERPTWIAPVGLVFQTIYEDCEKRGERPEDKGTLFHKLFEKDGSHPTGLGSIVAGLTIATAMTGYNPKLNPANPDSEDIILIQDAVSRTILETFHSGLIRYPWNEPWSEEEETCQAPSQQLADTVLKDDQTCDAHDEKKESS